MVRQGESGFLVRLGALDGLDQTLGELGVDAEALLAEHGLTLSTLAQQDQLVSIELAAALLEHSALVSGRPDFSLELAARQDVNLLGAVGLLLQTADTVREALLDISGYLRTTHVSHIYWTLVNRGDFDAFEVSAELPTLSSLQLRMVFELAIAQSFRIMRSVTGGRLEIAGVSFRHKDQEALPQLRRFFGVPVHAGGDFDGLVFEKGAIDLPISAADAQLHESVRQLILGQQVQLSVDSVAEQVKVLIRPLLPTGQCSIERIARFFACDKRTLQRHLRQDSDITFQQLLDEVRFDAACYYLSESTLPLTQLAALTGFSEPTNFSRAFRQRFGISPREWRKLHGKSPHRVLIARR
jgi:AraC-like DNA-binding protein